MSKVFGTPLLEIASQTNQAIPPFLETCFEFMMRNAEVEGIFRSPGDNAVIKRLILLLDSTNEFQITEDISPFVISNIITRFINHIPGHILIDSNQPKWDGELTLEQIKSNINELPRINQALLSRLFAFFIIICRSSHKNKMIDSNIAIILSPILVIDPDNPRWLLKLSNILLIFNNYFEVFGSLSSIDQETGDFLDSAKFNEKVGNIWGDFLCQSCIVLNHQEPSDDDDLNETEEKMWRGLTIPNTNYVALIEDLLGDTNKVATRQLTPL